MKSPSLEQHLSRMLAFAILAVGCLASLVSFQLSYMEAQELQDDTLQQIAALAGSGLLHRKALDADPAQLADIDPEMRIKLIRYSKDGKSPWLPDNLALGFHTVERPEGTWRVYVHNSTQGYRIAVAQATEARDEIALHSAMDTLLPLLVLLPLLGWLAVRIIRRGFAPLRPLAHSLEAQAAGLPTTLPDVGLPNEIIPFVHAINRQMERIQRLIGQQQRFIADASHELRTPLTALSLQAQNLEQAENCDDMRTRIAPLRAGIERARHLAEQLLNLARSQTGSRKLEALDLSQWSRELIANYLPRAEAADLDLGLEDPGNIILYTEPETLSLIIGNALDNAVRYTPAGGTITLRLLLSKHESVIEVQDSGSGIPNALQERVFTPFFRIEGSAGSGSGLGLAIARDAANRLGGAVSLRNADNGTGLVFSYRQATTPNPHCEATPTF